MQQAVGDFSGHGQGDFKYLLVQDVLLFVQIGGFCLHNSERDNQVEQQWGERTSLLLFNRILAVIEQKIGSFPLLSVEQKARNFCLNFAAFPPVIIKIF